MKKLVLSAMALTMLAVACKKDEVAATTNPLLLGKWTEVSDFNKVTKNGVSQYDTVFYSPVSYVDFRTDGKAYVYEYAPAFGINHSDTGSYTNNGNNLVFIGKSGEKNDLSIQTLTANSLIVLKKYSDTAATYETLMNFKK